MEAFDILHGCKWKKGQTVYRINENGKTISELTVTKVHTHWCGEEACGCVHITLSNGEWFGADEGDYGMSPTINAKQMFLKKEDAEKALRQ